MQGFGHKSLKDLALLLEIILMYRRKDRKIIPLFPELFPFDGKFYDNNCWLRIAELIPWEELEEYATHFSDVAHPGTDLLLDIGY